MNASASAQRCANRVRPLIIGIGNPLRGDDGLGWAVAEQLSRDLEIDGNIRTTHQLTPELASIMATANLVVMIDASQEGAPGELRIGALPLVAEPSAVGTHYTTPAELAAFTTAVYGHCPPVVVVSLTGADFDLGEQFSPVVAEKIPQVCAAVRQICLQ